LEFKQLAVSLLGKIPLNPPDHILERIHRWVQDESDTQIIDYVFVYGLSSVWAQDKEFVMDMIEGWLIDTDVYAKRLGIRALIPIVEDYSYENIPNVFRLIHRLTLTAPSDLNTDLIELITALAKRSPQETAYFLSQNLSHPESQHTARLIRKCKSEFPEDMQDYLLAAVRGIH
jgi:dihydroorotase-like cyclic amidohydrolase